MTHQRGEGRRGGGARGSCEIDATLERSSDRERVCPVIMVKTCVTNYRVQPANEHRLPDHAPYSITGERDRERNDRREEGTRVIFSFNDLRDNAARETQLFSESRWKLSLRSWRFYFFPHLSTVHLAVGGEGGKVARETKQHKVNTSPCV